LKGRETFVRFANALQAGCLRSRLNKSKFMKFRQSFLSSLILLSVLAAAFAQTKNVSPNKIAVIDRTAFDDRTNGIKEVVEADDQLETEFKSQAEELKALIEKIQKLQKEFEYYNSLKGIAYCVDVEILKKKTDEYDKLTAEFKQKQENARSLYVKRESEVFADINKNIAEAIKQFAKENGYALIIDRSAVEKGIITDVDDVTRDFVKFYNEDFAKREK
jgi:Skp family chaperone for outer membrane proteins